MSNQTASPTILLVTGPAAAVQDQVNELLADYAPLNWAWHYAEGTWQVLCLMVSEREMSRQRLSAAAMAQPMVMQRRQ